MDARIGEVAGDDYTMSVAVIGYEDFDDIKANFADRNSFVGEKYTTPEADPNELWELYKKEYNRYI